MSSAPENSTSDQPDIAATGVVEPSPIDDTIGVLAAFASREVDTYAAMLEEILSEPMRAARLVSGLAHVATSHIDQVAAHEGRDRWELIAEGRHGLERARRSNHPAHRRPRSG